MLRQEDGFHNPAVEAKNFVDQYDQCASESIRSFLTEPEDISLRLLEQVDLRTASELFKLLTNTLFEIHVFDRRCEALLTAKIYSQ